MALEDRDIFTAIFAKYSDQPIEFVMEQYEKAKLLNMAIEKRLWDQSRVVACPASESPAQKEEKKPEEPQDRVPEKKCYTQKDLKCDPAEAITDTSVTCCLCGKQSLTLTARHLAHHGITVEEHKKLCGYSEQQKLMAHNLLAKLTANAQRAQAARAAKRAEAHS